jgi:hypothetical protein
LLGFLLVPLAHAASAQFIADVGGNDPDANASYTNNRAALGFLDGNGDGHLQVANPAEPVYIDLDNSNSVTYGDIRLTAFTPYAAGTRVDLTNVDAGRPLASVTGWFAKGADGWVADLDGSGTLSVGDLRFIGEVPRQAMPGDADLGLALTPLVGGHNFAMTTGGGLFLDVDVSGTGGGRVSPGDARITPGPFAKDTPSTATGATTTIAPDPLVKTTEGGWRLLDGILVALAILNLAGLLFVVRSVNQLRGPPKSPFK